MTSLFTPYTLKDVTLRDRIVSGDHPFNQFVEFMPVASRLRMIMGGGR